MSDRSTRPGGTARHAEAASDPQAIERELDRTRTQMESTLDELRHRLTPEELLQMGLDYVRSGQGSEYLRNLREGVKANPLPVAFTAVGLAWTMLATRPGAQAGAAAATPRRRHETRAAAGRLARDRRTWVALGLALAAGAAAAAMPYIRRRRQAHEARIEQADFEAREALAPREPTLPAVQTPKPVVVATEERR